MKIPIFYAHPATDGHCSYILKRVREELAKKNLAHELYDLYSVSYDPLLHEDEHYTAGRYEISPQNKAIQEAIKESKWIIFIYPIWWGSMPAVLKGFFDRVLTSHYAFRYKWNIPWGLLRGKRAIVIITSGSPLWYLWLTGNRPKRLIKSDILGFCGIRAKVFQVGNCRKFEEKKKMKLARIAERAVLEIH